ERTTVAPTGIESVPLVDAERGRLRGERGWNERFVVLYAGSFNESYEIGRLVRVAERTAAIDPRILWVVAGGGRGRDEVVAAAEANPNLVFLGLLSRDRMWPWLQAADLGLVSLGPSPVLQLVIPGKLFDYAAAGLPILSTASGMAGAIVRAA